MPKKTKIKVVMVIESNNSPFYISDYEVELKELLQKCNQLLMNEYQGTHDQPLFQFESYLNKTHV